MLLILHMVLRGHIYLRGFNTLGMLFFRVYLLTVPYSSLGEAKAQYCPYTELLGSPFQPHSLPDLGCADPQAIL